MKKTGCIAKGVVSLMLPLLVFAAADTLQGGSPQLKKIAELHLVAVRGSKTGEEYVDPALGKPGEKIKEKLKLRRLEIMEEFTWSREYGWEVRGTIGEDLKLTVKFISVQRDQASFEFAVTRGRDRILFDHLTVRYGQTAMSACALDKDVLILLATAKLEEW